MRARLISRLALIGLLVLAVGVGAGVVSADHRTSDSTTGPANHSVTIDGVTVPEAIDAAGEADTVYVWSETDDGEPIETHAVTVETAANATDAELCIGTTCTPVGDDSTATIDGIEFDENGTSNVTVVLQNASSGAELDSETFHVQTIDREGDLDGDGLDNGREVDLGTNLVESDSDGDGLADFAELNNSTNPTLADSDGDGLTDAKELELGTDPLDVDTDDDGLDDAAELEHETDPLTADTDDDGLDDGEEVDLGTNPLTADTDDDGLSDGKERELGTNPLEVDSDDDGLDDAAELQQGTDPVAADTDEDGLSDGEELQHGTDPLVADSDDDGLVDGAELERGTDPLTADTDDDGLVDGKEVAVGTDPLQADSDGDFFADGMEQQMGTNPTSPMTPVGLGAVTIGFVSGILVSMMAINRGWVIAFTRAMEPYAYKIPLFGPSVLDVEDEADVEVTREETTGAPATAKSVFERQETDLLQDREIVQQMLEVEGEQMRQRQIVAATDWSKAKVSRLLSSMAEDDEVVKVPIGRENLICLEGAEPEIARPTAGPGAGPTGAGSRSTLD